MKKLSITKMTDTIIAKRKEQKLTQAQLAEMTGINRGMISRLESSDYTPSIDQLQSIAEVLNFEVVDLFEDDKVVSDKPILDKKYNIAVAGTGYVGLSIATLLSQHNHVTAVDIIPEKVELINNKKSPIQDDYIEMYLAEKDLDLTATLDGEEAYKNADFVVIAAPTNYDSKKNFFDCSAVEAVIELVLKVNPNATMIIKSTIPVGYTASVREKYNTKNIIFSQNSYVNQRHFTITYIHQESSYPVMKNQKKRLKLLPNFFSRVPSKKTSILFSWDSQKQKPLNSLPTLILHFVYLTSTNLIHTQNQKA